MMASVPPTNRMPPGRSELTKPLVNALLSLFGEVDDHVAARDEVERSTRVTVSQQFVLLEGDHGARLRTDRVAAIGLQDEPLGHARAAHVANVGGEVVASSASPIEDGLVDVRGQDAVVAPERELAQDNRHRVRLGADRAARAPDFDTRGAAAQQHRQDLAFEVAEAIRVAEELGHVDGDVVTELLAARGVLLEQTRIGREGGVWGWVLINSA